MEVIKQLIGRLHPLIVHLPIGFITLGLLVQWYARKRQQYAPVVPLIFLWGGFSAVLACITGYLQYLGEGYSFETVKWHLWLGIATALFSFIMFAKLSKTSTIRFLHKVPTALLSVLFFVLISFTGHEGGNITHGDDYLVEPLPNSVKSALGFETFEEKEIVLNDTNWEDALIYEDVIKPILNNKCVSCHNPKKTKGALQLHTPEDIQEGGENGAVILQGNAEKSELFSRMTLPMDDDDHMPPEGKTQPTKEEIKLVGAWIDAGHPFNGTIKTTGLPKELFAAFFPRKVENDYPDMEITEASQDSILTIEKAGIHVDLISKESNFLSVSAINKPTFGDDDFEILLPLKTQIARLDLGGTQVTDIIFEKLGQLPNLTILKLDHTSITGRQIKSLTILEHLKSINLTHTDFEGDYLSDLSDFQSLEKIYLFQSKVAAKEIQTLTNEAIQIDYGNYELPPLASDSIVY
ncbi:c-type cytochrome domain-containing protein [Maribacter sp. 2307UL18-2]|uniref:c-type cytochrome domain-containing protein n=1 Tax=Maribacter sp. 2307UL18-2 TaxID=3386274 RepID=UPI0039BD4DC6